jgi:hypothetical protein
VTILPPHACPTCGHTTPAPADGQWRYAAGGKVHQDLQTAELRARDLCRNKKFGTTHEAIGALDAEGNARIATRRRAS